MPGQYVQAGQVIGTLGDSGVSSGPHLHSQMQGAYGGVSISSRYHHVKTVNGSQFTDSWVYPESCSSDAWNPCAISVNEGVMGEKAQGFNASNIGSGIEPRASMDMNEGWGGYGWYSAYVACMDDDGDANTTCENDPAYRENVYIRRYSGGNWHETVIVYDALSGATEPYVVRSGFLMDSVFGWDTLNGPGSILGMPIEDERPISGGSEQYFQWGYLRWTPSENVTLHSYPTPIDLYRSVGPGVFAPDGTRSTYYWKRGTSYRFVDAWNRNGGAPDLGWPVSDNEADPGVHEWNGFYVQNFDGGVHGELIIMYDERSDRYADLDMFGDESGIPAEGWGRAYVIRTAFWAWYRYNDGMARMGAPIADEVNITGGAKQEFQCGWLEYSTSTGQVSVFQDYSREGCGTLSPPSGVPSYCIGTTTPTASQATYHSAGMLSEPMENTIYCSVGPVDTLVEITGPIEDGLWGPAPTGYPVYLEYGSNSDGWSPYTSGKPKKTYIGDYTSTGDPMTYSMTIGTYVQEMNFFLYEPATSEVEWFDIESWRITGDCYLDGTALNQVSMSYPEAYGEITCTLTEDDLIVDITGPVQALLAGWSVFEPTAIQYGSDTDGWSVPYTSGKVSEPWTGAYTHTIVLDPNIYNFNFFLTNGTSGEWFDLVDADWDGDMWTVNGDCWANGGAITHDPPPSTPVGTIDCEEMGPDMLITLTGPIEDGLWDPAPSGYPVYLEYGSNTDGWAPYTSGKPKKTWYDTFNIYQMAVGINVNEMNFFLYAPGSGAVSWFNLWEWEVTGDCWFDGASIVH